ncbi:MULTISPECIES: family 4B encapsulin nanocompartment shell protein [Thermococcus]|uniref:Family 4B encapsulin nanocompartment shell protein n=1 Tax=Thermococcus waiotapuensis TaxID=90909 RepID=A0AAE4NV96_9EURY|nr:MULTISPECIES: family 4B encapsulin nanocompartment shell protein [Thermococcus]MDV3103774.1 family 4B encapsulin nanocompartment shell protein [Thermococcus waiotapuensis]
MPTKEEVLEIIERAAQELREEGLTPDILLAGQEFMKHASGAVDGLGLSVYVVKELEFDAVIADSRYLGQMRKASKRISIEPLLVEEDVWEEIEKL